MMPGTAVLSTIAEESNISTIDINNHLQTIQAQLRSLEGRFCSCRGWLGRGSHGNLVAAREDCDLVIKEAQLALSIIRDLKYSKQIGKIFTPSPGARAVLSGLESRSIDLASEVLRLLPCSLTSLRTDTADLARAITSTKDQILHWLKQLTRELRSLQHLLFLESENPSFPDGLTLSNRGLTAGKAHGDDDHPCTAVNVSNTIQRSQSEEVAASMEPIIEPDARRHAQNTDNMVSRGRSAVELRSSTNDLKTLLDAEAVSSSGSLFMNPREENGEQITSFMTPEGTGLPGAQHLVNHDTRGPASIHSTTDDEEAAYVKNPPEEKEVNFMEDMDTASSVEYAPWQEQIEVRSTNRTHLSRMDCDQTSLRTVAANSIYMHQTSDLAVATTRDDMASLFSNGRLAMTQAHPMASCEMLRPEVHNDGMEQNQRLSQSPSSIPLARVSTTRHKSVGRTSRQSNEKFARSILREVEKLSRRSLRAPSVNYKETLLQIREQVDLLLEKTEEGQGRLRPPPPKTSEPGEADYLNNSVAIPDDGEPVTIMKSVSVGSQKDQTHLLIEYFEAAKKDGHEGLRKPSVRVKVTPSSTTRSKSHYERLQPRLQLARGQSRGSRRLTSEPVGPRPPRENDRDETESGSSQRSADAEEHAVEAEVSRTISGKDPKLSKSRSPNACAHIAHCQQNQSTRLDDDATSTPLRNGSRVEPEPGPSLDDRERQRVRSRRRSSRSATAANGEEVFRKHAVPPMPLRSDVGSELTRESLLSSNTFETTIHTHREVHEVVRGYGTETRVEPEPRDRPTGLGGNSERLARNVIEKITRRPRATTEGSGLSNLGQSRSSIYGEGNFTERRKKTVTKLHNDATHAAREVFHKSTRDLQGSGSVPDYNLALRDDNHATIVRAPNHVRGEDPSAQPSIGHDGLDIHDPSADARVSSQQAVNDPVSDSGQDPHNASKSRTEEGAGKMDANNPRLLQTVEDAIRRLILPELNALKNDNDDARRHWLQCNPQQN